MSTHQCRRLLCGRRSEAPVEGALTESSMVACQRNDNALTRLKNVLGYTLHAITRSYAQCLQRWTMMTFELLIVELPKG